MSNPVHKTLGAVTRSVTAREENGRTAFVIVATRRYATDVDDLWDALTNASRLEQWFLPVSGDLRESGNFQFEGNAGGEIRECAAPGHLVVTWGMGDDTSLLDLKLAALDAGRTELTLEHTGNAEQWMLSDEGKDFSRQSAAAWRNASVAGGAAPDAADRAAAGAAAFYTGETAPRA